MVTSPVGEWGCQTSRDPCGTRSHHCFKPLSRDKLSLSRVSFDHDKHSTVHPIGVTEGSNENDQTNYTVGVYVAKYCL